MKKAERKEKTIIRPASSSESAVPQPAAFGAERRGTQEGVFWAHFSGRSREHCQRVATRDTGLAGQCGVPGACSLHDLYICQYTLSPARVPQMAAESGLAAPVLSVFLVGMGQASRTPSFLPPQSPLTSHSVSILTIMFKR